MERKCDLCGPLRTVLLAKLNHQRRLAVSSLALLFGDKIILRAAVASRWSELADYVTFADRDELHALTTALHRWRMRTPLTMPSLDDLRQEVNLGDVSRN